MTELFNLQKSQDRKFLIMKNSKKSFLILLMLLALIMNLRYKVGMLIQKEWLRLKRKEKRKNKEMKKKDKKKLKQEELEKKEGDKM